MFFFDWHNMYLVYFRILEREFQIFQQRTAAEDKRQELRQAAHAALAAGKLPSKLQCWALNS